MHVEVVFQGSSRAQHLDPCASNVQSSHANPGTVEVLTLEPLHIAISMVIPRNTEHMLEQNHNNT